MVTRDAESKNCLADDDVELDSPSETDPLTISESDYKPSIPLDKRQLGILCFARTIESWYVMNPQQTLVAHRV